MGRQEEKIRTFVSRYQGKQKVRKERITKVEFHRLGGFSNSQLFRLQSRGGAWRYYRRVD